MIKKNTELSCISYMRRHSKLEVDEFNIECANFADFHRLENVVGRILSFFEFSSNSTQYFIENIVEKSEGKLVFEIDNTIFPIAGKLTHQNIITQFAFKPLNILKGFCLFFSQSIHKV